MKLEESHLQNIQYGGDGLVAGYPVTNFMTSNAGQIQSGGASRLEGLVVPLGLVLDNLPSNNCPDHKYKERSETLLYLLPLNKKQLQKSIYGKQTSLMLMV